MNGHITIHDLKTGDRNFGNGHIVLEVGGVKKSQISIASKIDCAIRGLAACPLSKIVTANSITHIIISKLAGLRVKS